MKIMKAVLLVNKEETQLKNILILGNAGSGKSTLAKNLAEKYQLAHLDLDMLAWEATTPPTRKPLKESEAIILEFLVTNKHWVIEGCYTDLLELVEEFANEVIFMNLSIDECVMNAKSRPWEFRKYESKEAQDADLPMLIDWIEHYEERDDTFSKAAHQNFYDKFEGEKLQYNHNGVVNDSICGTGVGSKTPY